MVGDLRIPPTASHACPIPARLEWGRSMPCHFGAFVATIQFVSRTSPLKKPRQAHFEMGRQAAFGEDGLGIAFPDPFAMAAVGGFRPRFGPSMRIPYCTAAISLRQSLWKRALRPVASAPLSYRSAFPAAGSSPPTACPKPPVTAPRPAPTPPDPHSKRAFLSSRCRRRCSRHQPVQRPRSPNREDPSAATGCGP